jgi:multicomponent Na+:H+ antiporter subunit E
MPQATHSARDNLKGFAWLFGTSIVLWLALTSQLNLPELIAGCVVCLVVSLLAARIYSTLGLPPISIKRVFFALVYVIVLLTEIIKANFDVAYRVLHPRMPIKPGIVVVKTSLKSDIAKLVLANSITLTPGTFTLDVIGDELLIHWINVKAEDVDGATKMIGGRFEKFLRIIFT